MATLKDIAKIVASQHGMKPAEAEKFLQQFVETVNEGINADKLVKIKGFGTFKMQTVKPRSSINVNTGERVVISGHDRITFLPDAAMKDAINRPFGHFETVEIADGSPLLDEAASEDDSEEEVKEEEVREEELEETKDEETPVQEEEPVVQEEEPVEEKVEPVEEKVEPIEEEEEPVFVMAPKKPAKAAAEDIEEPESISERMQGNSNVFIGIAAGILIVIAAIVGFSKFNSDKTPVTPAVQPAVVADTVKNDTVKNDSIKKDTVAIGKDTTQVAKDDSTSVSKKKHKKKRRGRRYRRHRRRG
jgi:nucleoid DNA-binding protein